MIEKMKKYFSFEGILKFLVIILPFNVIITVFFEYKIWFHWFWIYKELIIFYLLSYLLFWFYKNKKLPKFDIIDYSIFWYIWYLLLISLINKTWLKAIVFWWRYDFEFLLIFLITKHWRFLLKEKLSYYLKTFLISASIAVGIWILVRFVLWEWVLLHFGFSPYLSSWNFDKWVPIYHWIEWANVRRFQWIFDWPNQTAFFLIFYCWLLFHYFRTKKEHLFYIYCVLFVMWGLVFLTYSRSALLWILGWLWILFLLNIVIIFKKFRTQSLVALFFIIILWWIFYIRYWGHMEDIILRAWSTKWHSERMIEWFNQFLAKPMWKWLASSGPWYRATHELKVVDEKHFIPESWYVQQLVEWWIIWFLLFVFIMLGLLVQIYPLSKSLFCSFVAVLIMNIVLHTFETSYVSILLFLFLWLFLGKKELK